MSIFTSTKVIELGSSAFRQWRAFHSHCRFVHGYQLKAKFWFGCSSLDDKNWAADFGNLKDLKQKLQDTFDHKMLIAADDPHLEDFKQLEVKGVIQLSVFENGVGIERAAEYCFKTASDIIKQKYGTRVWVQKVEVFEHEDNSAIYESPHKYEKYLGRVQTMIDDSLNAAMSSDEPAHNPELFHKLATPVVTTDTHKPTQINQEVTSGRGDWFKGTSWGN